MVSLYEILLIQRHYVAIRLVDQIRVVLNINAASALIS